MGVTKVLMASNDTLFNFEDTLGDREDMLSPRNVNSLNVTSTIAAASSGGNSVKSMTPQPENCKTPTNEGFLAAYPVECKPNDLNSDNHLSSNEIRPNSLQLNFENLTNNLGDLLSPEQQKTLSEEINTIEQLSASDLSATIDATNTLDDLKTCISVHMTADGLELDDNSDSGGGIPIEKQSSNQITNSPIHGATTNIDIIEMQTAATDADEPPMAISVIPPPNGNNDDDSGGDMETTTSANSSEHVKRSAAVQCDLLEPIESAKENTSPNLELQANANVTRTEIKSKLNKTNNELNENRVKMDSVQSNNDLKHVHTLRDSTERLSGEEDPWVNI